MEQQLTLFPVTQIGTLQQGDDIAAVILCALDKQNLSLAPNDIIVITQKIVSKAEGRVVNLQHIEPSPFAKEIAQQAKKDPRHIEVILRETQRIVRMDHGVLICETKHGFICANAGIDASNVEGENAVTLLPEDPDASAKQILQRLQKGCGKDSNLAVIISDTWGRPWREGQVNFAIGVAGMATMIDYRGQRDQYGHVLQVSQIAIADEIAAAAELVMGKTERIPVAVVRGYSFRSKDSAGKTLLRDPKTDMFR